MKRSQHEQGGKPTKRTAGESVYRKVAQRNNTVSPQSVAHLAGTRVEPEVRRAGDFLLGPRLGASPVKSITHCLGRRDGTDSYYQLKVLSLVVGEGRGAKETQDERQGKMLLHTEHSLLSLLAGVPGVVQKHQTFMDSVPEEEEGRYTGRMLRRVVLVLDCLSPHHFSMQTRDLINLQHHVIREKKLNEKETLVIFYAVIEIVCNLHEANIVHRDLKLGNIVLDKRSNKVTITNFCLGKHLMNDTDLLKDQRGSPAYISPDVLSGKPYLGKPSDMWALGVVLFTMLYGQFPFYDSAPQELFNKIKTAEFSIPDDGRVSEDTKSVIKRLLVTDPDRRLTAVQVRRDIEGIIIMWRNISPGAGSSGAGLQEVPEWKEGAVRARTAEMGRGLPGVGLCHENVLLNLSQGREGGGEDRRKGGEMRGRGRTSGIPVHRLGEDARPLTAEEYRLYSPVITEMRGGARARRGGTSSTVAQVLVRQRPGLAGGGQSTAGVHPSQAPPPHLSALPATVPDQAEVLDLSSGPRRDSAPPRPVPPPYIAAAPSGPAVAHVQTRQTPRHEDRALSLVGALRRLGTRVNLVPVNFSSHRRNTGAGASTGAVRGEERRRSGTSGVPWQGDRRHRDGADGGGTGGGSRSRVHSTGETGARSSRSSAGRERQAAVIERISEYRRGRVNTRAEERNTGLTYVSRLSPELGLAMPLAEATRLLATGWEPGQLREADQFVRDLEASQGTSTVEVTAEAGSSGGGEGDQYYNPSQPTETETSPTEAAETATGVTEGAV